MAGRENERDIMACIRTNLDVEQRETEMIQRSFQTAGRRIGFSE